MRINIKNDKFSIFAYQMEEPYNFIQMDKCGALPKPWNVLYTHCGYDSRRILFINLLTDIQFDYKSTSM
jgi:hypothetical protein